GDVTIDGGYSGQAANPTVLNHETGDSEALRCDALRGVLRWNVERDVQLPTAVPGFCSVVNDCPGFSSLARDPKIMQNENGQPDLHKMFIAPGPPTTERLINNTAIFESVRDVATDFRLDARHAWLLRYAARWSVARRIWELCAYNRPLLDRLAAGAWRVCNARLPRRERDDRLGSVEFGNAGF